MGLDVSAQIIIGWRIEDLVETHKVVRSFELYNEKTGQNTGKTKTETVWINTRFDGKIQEYDREDEALGYQYMEDLEMLLQGRMCVYDIDAGFCSIQDQPELFGVIITETGSNRDGTYHAVVNLEKIKQYITMVESTLGFEKAPKPQVFLFNHMSY